jgi:ABC-type Fe3+/spermidine/putrescine transport system ATPase subunit
VTDRPILTIAGLGKTFGDSVAVADLSVEVGSGEMLALLGPSGCGKTTTLRMIAGLERPTSGEIAFAGRKISSSAEGIFVPPDQRNFGMVFQSYALWPHMTVEQNIAYPLKLRRTANAEIRARVDATVALMGLTPFVQRTVNTLSGGQQQRAALARALVYSPAVVLFDEPFSNLDTQLRTQMRAELKTLQKDVQMTGVFVTHDQIEALSLADRIAIMNAGRVEQIGSPEDVYDRPVSRFVYDFLGKSITFEGVVNAVGTDGTARIAVGTGGTLRARQTQRIVPQAGATVAVSVRPGYVRVFPDGAEEVRTQSNAVPATIRQLLYVGDHYEARVAIGASSTLLELPRAGRWQDGQRVVLAFDEADASIWPVDVPA